MITIQQLFIHTFEHIAERADEKLQRKNIVKMGIKVVQMASAPPPPTPTPRSDQPKGWRQKGPQATSEKPFLLSDGKVTLEANLDKAIYTHGDPIHVSISVRNTSKKAVRRIKVKLLQNLLIYQSQKMNTFSEYHTI